MKNIARNVLGDKVARIHMKKQNFDGLGGRRMNALRKKRSLDDADRNESATKKQKK